MSRVALSVLILIFDVVAVAGNATVIVAFIRNKKLRKPSGCYVTNLATADFCMSIVGIPFYVATVFLNMWPFGDYFCAIWTCLEKVVTLVSNFAIVAICYDRYWLVTKSSDYLSRHSVGKAGTRIAIIWMSAILFRVPFVIFGIYWTWGKQSQLTPCDPRSVYDIPLQVGLYGFDTAYTVFTALCEFGVPLLLISIWGVQVYIYLKSREKVRLLKAMKVERSRAMSIDFCMADMVDMDPGAGENQHQTRSFSISPGKLCRSTFWSNLRSRDGHQRHKARSQDTLAGVLSEVEHNPSHHHLISQFRSSSSLPQSLSQNEFNVSGQSGVNITLNPAETSTADLSSSMDIPTLSGDGSMRTSLSCNDITTRSPSPNLSIHGQRRSSSLDTLQVPSFSLRHKRRGTTRRVPSAPVSLSVYVPVTVATKSEDQIAPADCNNRSLDGRVTLHLASGTERNNEHSIENCSTVQALLRANGCFKKPVTGTSSLPCSDFLEVPDPRPTFTLDSEGQPEESSAGSTDSVVAEHQQHNHRNRVREPSVGSSASDLPDSINSSIMTVSEPPSPSLNRCSSSLESSVSFGAAKGIGLKARKRYYSYKRRALFTIILMICVFVVFQLPYLVISTMYSFCYGDCISDELYEAANWWYWAKIVLNPLLYAYISPEFRRYSLALIKCRKKRTLR